MFTPRKLSPAAKGIMADLLNRGVPKDRIPMDILLNYSVNEFTQIHTRVSKTFGRITALQRFLRGGRT